MDPKPSSSADRAYGRRCRARQSLIALAAAGLCICAPASQAQNVTFSDQTDTAGVSYVQWNGVLPAGVTLGVERGYFYAVGGAAAGDYDNDGWPDLYATRAGGTDVLLRNKRDGTFEDVAASAGVALRNRSSGCGWADFNNDGLLDLVVLTFKPTGHNHLFVNNGDGTFRDEGIERGIGMLDSLRYFSSPIIGDIDLDGDLDLLILSWQGRNRLFVNDGNGYFTGESNRRNLDLHGTQGFAGQFSDLDDDGWPEVVVAGDFGTSRMFRNLGGGFFEDITSITGVGTDENGMGSAVGDIDGDGRLDWFVSSIFDPDTTCVPGEICPRGPTGNRVYRNIHSTLFDDATDAFGVRDGRWGWGASFLDFNNDGARDLTMAAGMNVPYTDEDDPFNDDPLRLWQNDGTGVMTDVAAQVGFVDTRGGRGLVVFDYDRDGDEDVFVVHNRDTPILLRNDGGNANPWLQVALRGTVSNHFGIGAKIRVQATPEARWQLQEVSAGSNYMSQNDVVVHFGLGNVPNRIHRVRVTWPASGAELDLYNVRPNERLVLHEMLCLGDIDGDSRVTLSDLERMLMHFGITTAAGPWEGDLSGDGRVELRDLVVLLSNFGVVCE